MNSSTQAIAAGFLNFFIGGVFISPAEIFFDSSGKQGIFLENHGDGIPQMGKGIVLHRMPVNENASFRRFIESWNQLHQRTFGSTSLSDDPTVCPGRMWKEMSVSTIFFGIFISASPV